MGSALSALMVGVVFMFAYMRARSAVISLSAKLAAAEEWRHALERQIHELRIFEERVIDASEEKAKAISERIEAGKRISALEFEIAEANSARGKAEAVAAEANQKSEIAKVNLQQIEKRLQDWEQAKTESIQTAKAAIMEVGSKLSSSLIENHRREAEEAKKQGEESVKKTTETLFKEMEKVTGSVSILDNQVKQSAKIADTVWRALTSPQGAGYYGEIGLENTLKSFGLHEGRDFVMQYSITRGEGKNLRPDALVFLPHGNLMVIDSKASKHIVELAASEGAADEKEKLSAFSKSMATHLRTLAGREYESAIKSEYKESGRTEAVGEIINVMYLPSEAAIAKLTSEDPEFKLKAFALGIIVAGPETIAGMIALCRIKLENFKQIENYNKIMDSVRILVESISTSLKYADDIGKSIKKSAESYASFSNSVNKRLLPKAHSIVASGVRLGSTKALPVSLPLYHVVSTDVSLIENVSASEDAELESV